MCEEFGEQLKDFHFLDDFADNIRNMLYPREARVMANMRCITDTTKFGHLGWPWFRAVDNKGNEVSTLDGYNLPQDCHWEYDFLTLAKVLTYARYTRWRHKQYLKRKFLKKKNCTTDENEEDPSLDSLGNEFTGDIVVAAFYLPEEILDAINGTTVPIPGTEDQDDDGAESEGSCEDEPVWGNLPLSGKKYDDSRKKRTADEHAGSGEEADGARKKKSVQMTAVSGNRNTSS
jgi:hypothetical protein